MDVCHRLISLRIVLFISTPSEIMIRLPARIARPLGQPRRPRVHQQKRPLPLWNRQLLSASCDFTQQNTMNHPTGFVKPTFNSLPSSACNRPRPALPFTRIVKMSEADFAEVTFTFSHATRCFSPRPITSSQVTHMNRPGTHHLRPRRIAQG